MFQLNPFDDDLNACDRYVRSGHCVCVLVFFLICDETVPCWWYVANLRPQYFNMGSDLVSAVIFICDGRIGLCCVYVVFLVTYPHEFINRDIDAHRWGECSGARALTDS